MNKIPTLENFYEIKSKQLGYVNFLEFINKHQDIKIKILLHSWNIEFTKLHVKAAIKECIESAPSGSSTDTVSYEDVVEALKDCYPESNIK